MASAAVKCLQQEEPCARVSDMEMIGWMIQIHCGFSDRQGTRIGQLVYYCKPNRLWTIQHDFPISPFYIGHLPNLSQEWLRGSYWHNIQNSDSYSIIFCTETPNLEFLFSAPDEPSVTLRQVNETLGSRQRKRLVATWQVSTSWSASYPCCQLFFSLHVWTDAKQIQKHSDNTAWMKRRHICMVWQLR